MKRLVKGASQQFCPGGRSYVADRRFRYSSSSSSRPPPHVYRQAADPGDQTPERGRPLYWMKLEEEEEEEGGAMIPMSLGASLARPFLLLFSSSFLT
ncbi:hypothetical protein CRUP_012314 [Coryphaenoides rupestris]|nr:hypothetical protein CRUP_012314 [Coryphaenoides rupestris]